MAFLTTLMDTSSKISQDDNWMPEVRIFSTALPADSMEGKEALAKAV